MTRVVITGTGMVSPLGCGTDVTWSRLLAGQNGSRLVTEFEVDDLPAKMINNNFLYAFCDIAHVGFLD
ncbi:beta-ketoacyl synthase N-terminal-like domain-containing protein, partial [Rhizobium johnstonii]|uniref:beta-ketoacyl synthase N-terminal-like domain-containing protein n=1 Tax=Rhizobium johnstonii TaxID=3019933 RepID=UPI003F98D0E6